MVEPSGASEGLEGDQGGTPDGHAPRSHDPRRMFRQFSGPPAPDPDPTDSTAQIWERCQGFDKGHEVDSRVHWYHREVGFQREQADQEMIDRNPATAAAYLRSSARACLSSGCSARCPTRRTRNSSGNATTSVPFLRFIGPPVALVVTFMDALRSWDLGAGVKRRLN